MKHFSLALLTIFAAFALRAQTGVYSPLMHKTDSLINKFMQTYAIGGGTAAITKDGRLIYNRAFGFSNQAKTDTAKPYNLFRIASNSKPITGVAIMKLVQDGVLSLNDTVFGANRILNQSYYLNAITDNRVYNITIRQLLEHTGGWNRDVSCDGFAGCDPISFPLHVASTMGEGNPVGDSTLIKFLLTKSLNFTPGTQYAYSNIGYLVLAKVIEKKTGMKYDAYVKSSILQPLGLCDMTLGKNLLADKQEREGEYISNFTTQSCYGTGQTVPWQYGGWNLEAMHAHGGWISSSEDYVRFILAVDGNSTVPDILNASTITTMTTPSFPASVNANYAKGWSVNSAGNWWHVGSLDGTVSFMCRTNSGYTWAFHFNARTNSNAFYNALDALPWNCLATTTSYPTYNLFAPSQQATALTAAKSGNTSVQLNWTAGSGDHRIVLATESTGWKDFPVEGRTYTANAAYGQGAALNSTTYVVYNGSGTSATITNLDAAKTYQFVVLEAANSATTGNNEVYKYGCHPNATVNMATTSVPSVGLLQGIGVYPNPVGNGFTLENRNSKLYGTTATISDVAGRQLMQVKLSTSGKQTVNTNSLASGTYLLHFSNGAVMKLVK